MQNGSSLTAPPDASSRVAIDSEITFGQGRPIDYYGNRETMNLSQLVFMNCRESHYTMKELSKVTDLWGIIDHIVKYVKHLEAWERGSENQSTTKFSGGVRGVARSGLISSAFCIILKLNEFNITMGDLYELAKYKKNVFVQGLTLIYARFVLTHQVELWKFFRHFVTIEDRIVNVSNTFNKSMTLGQIARSLLLEPKWCGQVLPRVSSKTLQQFEELIDAKMQEVKDKKNNNSSSSHHSKNRQFNGKRDRDHNYSYSRVSKSKYSDNR